MFNRWEGSLKIQNVIDYRDLTVYGIYTTYDDSLGFNAVSPETGGA